MILEAIINIFGELALFIIRILPDFPSLADIVSRGVVAVFDVIYAINFIIDVKILGSCLAILIVFCNVEFAYNIIMWIVRKIPGVS